MPWEKNDTQIRHRVRDPGDFKEGSFRTLTLPGVKGISIVRGKLTSNDEWATQALRFDTEEWDEKKAKAWVEEHKDKFNALDDLLVQTRVPIRHATLFSDNLQVSYEEAEDGTFTIRDVPVFELGEHRGFNYDDEWARRAMANFRTMKAEHGYAATVIIGHTTDDPKGERPAVGFMDNLRLVGKRFIADLVHIGKDLFEQIKAGNWPYRSIEVFDNLAQITAVALLGGTPPYMKTAPLMFGDERGKWVRFNAPDEETGMTPEQITALEARLTALESEKTALKARADTAETTLTTFKAEATTRLSAAAEELRQARITRFLGEITELGIAPGVQDSAEFKGLVQTFGGEGVIVRFADKDVPGLEGLRQFMGVIAEQAKKGALLRTPPGETAAVNEPGVIPDDARRKYGDNVDEDSLNIVAQVNALVAKGGYNHLPEPLRFQEAYKDLGKSRATA